MRPSEALHRPDIHNIGSIEQGPPRFDFDPKKEITEEAWNLFTNSLGLMRLEGSRTGTRRFAQFAANLSALDRERTSDLINYDDWSRMIHKLVDLHPKGLLGNNWMDYINMAGSMAVLDAEKTRAVLWTTDRNEMTDAISSFRTRQKWSTLVTVASEVAQIYPKSAGELITTADAAEVMKLYQTRNDTTNEHWWFYVHLMARVAELLPGFVAEHLTAEEWSEISRWRESDDFTNSFDHAAKLASLTRLARVAKLRPAAENPAKPLPTTKKY